mgnify:CR=1 FL=1
MVITETEPYLCIKPYKPKYKNSINQKPYKPNRIKPKKPNAQADFQHYILALGTAVMIPAVLVPMMGGSDVSAPLRFLIRTTPHGLAPGVTSFSANNVWWCSRLAISDGLQGDRVRVVQTLLFVTGINTLLQSLFGTRLPTVIGSSYAFLIPVMAIVQDSSLAAIPDDHEVSNHSFTFTF